MRAASTALKGFLPATFDLDWRRHRSQPTAAAACQQSLVLGRYGLQDTGAAAPCGLAQRREQRKRVVAPRAASSAAAFAALIVEEVAHSYGLRTRRHTLCAAGRRTCYDDKVRCELPSWSLAAIRGT